MKLIGDLDMSCFNEMVRERTLSYIRENIIRERKRLNADRFFVFVFSRNRPIKASKEMR